MTDTSYISSTTDYETDKIHVWERPVQGGPRSLVQYTPPRYFYVPDENGKYLSTDLPPIHLRKVEFDDQDEHKAGLRKFPVKYESDITPEARVLMNEYYDRPTPVINYAFVDIEVDYKSTLGFSSPKNPYAPINAVTIYQSWTKEYLTIAVPPPGWKMDDGVFEAKIRDMWEEHKLGFEPIVMLVKSERELLHGLLGAIEDADIISGWNSEFFDNPYIIKRIEQVLGKRAMAKMCFTGARPPRERMINRFGTEEVTYTLNGRTHLDYLDMFKKFTFEGRVSYSLGNIAAEELDVPKLEYDGTLEQLYHKDFIHFITYNARDVEVIVKLDEKFNLMQLVNQMAHENTVPFTAIMGTVRYVETGIINRAHNVHNRIVPNKVMGGEDNAKVEGAVVLTPQAGLHEWLGSVDITSLYPSVIRALNMSIETFIGQFAGDDQTFIALRDTRQRFRNVTMTFKKHGVKPNVRFRSAEKMQFERENEYTFVHADGLEETRTWSEWNKWIDENGFAISGFGTVFSQSTPGMVADTLTYWFNERKRLQAEKKRYGKLADAETDPVKKKEYEKLEEHYDLLQLTKKIQLNSCYGALLNEAFRFGRREIGASVTATGREITLHMAETIGELATGQPAEIEKYLTPEKVKGAGPDDPVVYSNTYFTNCDAIIYGDTDSTYFKTYATNKEEAIIVADEIAAQTNATFPAFMTKFFNCTDGRETLIKAAREIVGQRGIFLKAKKKYTIRVVDSEGKSVDKLKSMGSEIKKADTPKAVQDFLKEMMGLILDGKDYKTLETFVNKNRGSLIRDVKNILDLAPAKQVNNLDDFYSEYKRTEKVGDKMSRTIPGHVRSAINFNEMLERLEDTSNKPMKAGDKAVIVYLKPNDFGIKNIGFPAELSHLPPWFDDHFKVDIKTTETKMIDNKCEKIFDALGWDMPTPKTAFLNSVFSFE